MAQAENPRAVPGDNSGLPSPAVDPSSVAGDKVKSFLERVERVEEEIAGLRGDVKDIYAEAKANGFDTKVLRKLVALRRQDPDKRQEFAAILDLYASAIGMPNVFA